MDYSRFKIRTPSLGILSRSMLCRSQISKGSTEYFREFNIQPILHRHRHTDTQTQKSPSKNNALINELAPKSNPDPTMRHSPSNAPPPSIAYTYLLPYAVTWSTFNSLTHTPDEVLRSCSVYRTMGRGGCRGGLRRTGINPTSDHTCKSNISGSCASHV